jgi:hypothetical protein
MQFTSFWILWGRGNNTWYCCLVQRFVQPIVGATLSANFMIESLVMRGNTHGLSIFPTADKIVPRGEEVSFLSAAVAILDYVSKLCAKFATVCWHFHKQHRFEKPRRRRSSCMSLLFKENLLPSDANCDILYDLKFSFIFIIIF